jgi:hypothetical protein
MVRGAGRQTLILPALAAVTDSGEEPPIEAIWRGEVAAPGVEARIIGTIALGLLALGRGADEAARAIWLRRTDHGPR